MLWCSEISLRNFPLSSRRYEMKEYWSEVSYCLNNCLPSKVIVPNTHVFLCEPVATAIGRFPSGVHIFLINVNLDLTYTLSAWGSSRSTVVISSTVPKHFVHQFNTFVDLLKGYIGKPYLSLS
jgi:hypothetical protein